MNFSEIFRFPEENEREKHLRNLTSAEVLGALGRIAADLPEIAGSDEERRQARAILSVLDSEIGRFLAGQNHRVDVFGHLRDERGFYADFCAMQEVIREGVRRLETIRFPDAGGSPCDRYAEWAVIRLSQGVHSDPVVAVRAAELAERIRSVQAIQTQETERTARLREILRRFLWETVPSYCARSLSLSDAANGGKSVQAGQLLGLVGELKTAVGQVLRTIETA